VREQALGGALPMFSPVTPVDEDEKLPEE